MYCDEIIYDMNIFLSLLKAINKNFKYYALYSTGSHSILIFMSNHISSFHLRHNIFLNKNMSYDLEKIGINAYSDLDLLWIASEKILRPYIINNNVKINSDYFPYSDVWAVKSRFLQENIRKT